MTLHTFLKALHVTDDRVIIRPFDDPKSVGLLPFSLGLVGIGFSVVSVWGGFDIPAVVFLASLAATALGGLLRAVTSACTIDFANERIAESWVQRPIKGGVRFDKIAGVALSRISKTVNPRKAPPQRKSKWEIHVFLGEEDGPVRQVALEDADDGETLLESLRARADSLVIGPFRHGSDAWPAAHRLARQSGAAFFDLTGDIPRSWPAEHVGESLADRMERLDELPEPPDDQTRGMTREEVDGATVLTWEQERLAYLSFPLTLLSLPIGGWLVGAAYLLADGNGVGVAVCLGFALLTTAIVAAITLPTAPRDHGVNRLELTDDTLRYQTSFPRTKVDELDRHEIRSVQTTPAAAGRTRDNGRGSGMDVWVFGDAGAIRIALGRSRAKWLRKTIEEWVWHEVA